MLQEALHIFTDPGHILAEFLFALCEGVVVAFAIQPLIRRHDRRKHSKEQ